jgi:hypothetical protein
MMPSTKEEPHKDEKSNTEVSPTLTYEHSYKHTQTHNSEKCIEHHVPLLRAIQEKIRRMRVHLQFQVGSLYNQVVSARNLQRYSKKAARDELCKKSTNRTEFAANYPETPSHKNPLAAPGEPSLLQGPSSSSHNTGMLSAPANEPQAITAPKWDPNSQLGQGHDAMRAVGVLLSVMMAVILTLLLVLLYARIMRRKWKGGARGRGGRAVGPWDERAEEGLVVYESGEYRD